MIKIIILKPDASLAISFTGRNEIQKPIAIPVMIIDKWGVLYFGCTFSIDWGSKLSLAIANGNLDVAITPAKAIPISMVIAKNAEICAKVWPATESTKT